MFCLFFVDLSSFVAQQLGSIAMSCSSILMQHLQQGIGYDTTM